jgi:TetR/AcrR family transcriptional regulator, cholesterol catabolism regulator
MNYADFVKMIQTSKRDVYRETLADNRNTIRVSKEQTVVRNLEKIFEATLRISNEKGFQAMSMRDLTRATGLSSGGLYAYFVGKTELLEMLLRHGRNIVQRILISCIAEEPDSVSKLRAAIRTHLHLSEYMQPWFYFSYMEAKNLSKPDREKVIESELATEQLFGDIIRQGQAEAFFANRDVQLTAGVLKAMVQDWYLKRWKFARRDVSVDQYADFVTEFVETFLKVPDATRE